MKVGPGKWGRTKSSSSGGGSVWPTSTQTLLLKAGLFEGRESNEAWCRLQSEFDIETADPASGQLLPLVYRNLARENANDLALQKLKRHYLVTWASNQKLFRQLGETLKQFQDAGIRTLVLKGAALVPLYFEDEGVRGMGDFDILVPEDQFIEACGILTQDRWNPLHYDPRYFDTRFEHAIAFLDDYGNSVDLHCHALIHSCEHGADDPFWEGSQPLVVAGVESRTLNATDHLLQVCAHGLTWVKHPPVRWAADAATILKVAGVEIDWDRLIRLAKARGVTLHVAAPLAYLKTTLDAPVPEQVITALRSASASSRHRRQHQNWMRNRRGQPVPLLLLHWTMYTRGIGPVSLIERITMIPQYLRFWAHTDRLWKIPATLSMKGLRVVGRRLGLYEYWDES